MCYLLLPINQTFAIMETLIQSSVLLTIILQPILLSFRLDIACEQGHVDCLGVLLERCADVISVSKAGL